MATVGPTGCVCVCLCGEGMVAAMDSSRCPKGTAGRCFLLFCVLFCSLPHCPGKIFAHSFTITQGNLRAGLGEAWIVIQDTSSSTSKVFIHLCPTLIHTNTHTHIYMHEHCMLKPAQEGRKVRKTKRKLLEIGRAHV